MAQYYLSIALLICITNTATAAVKPVNLEIAQSSGSVGLSASNQILRWSLSADEPDIRQHAFEVNIATSPDCLENPDVWKSGKIHSNRSEIAIPESAMLQSGKHYYWQVRVWNQHKEMSNWSGVNHFSTGLNQEDWSAAWITPTPFVVKNLEDTPTKETEVTQRPVWWLRRTIEIEKVPEKVSLSLVCLGYYELYINGKRVGNEPLAPSVTKLDKRGLSIVHEIGGLLKPGKNCIAIACASGWYVPHQFDVHEQATPLIRLQAYTRKESKLVTLFASDGQWLAYKSNRSITGAWKWNRFGGEAVDGRLDDSIWKEINTETKDWGSVRVTSAPNIKVMPRTCPPNRIGATYKAKKVRELAKGVYEIDFGLCLAGLVRFDFPDISRDKELVIRFFDLPADNNRKKDHSYRQVSTYVANGDGSDRFQSKFNYAGFRYATISGLESFPKLEDFEAYLVETANDPSGTFRCSNELFNQIHDLNAHTIRCLNLGGYHVDCPHRERNGYGADAQTALPAYTYLFNSEAFLRKWLIDWQDVFEPASGRISHTAPIKHHGESPAWGGIVGPLAWKLYLFYGDRKAIEVAFPIVKANLEHLQKAVRNGIMRKQFAGKPFHGDWVPPGRGMNTKTKPTVPMKELFNTAYLIYLWQTYAEMGRVLGEDEEVSKAKTVIASMQNSFHAFFYDETTGYYLLPEQAYQAMPLLVGAVPDTKREEIHAKLIDLIENKRNGHLDTGLPSTTFLLDYLEKSDCHETIHIIMNKKTYPSWGYMLEQGATTIWEQWDGYWSQIHSCFAGPASWFYTGLAGIRPVAEYPGFERFELKPAFIKEIDYVEATYHSVRGPIGSHWQRNGQAIEWTVTIPPNSHATVYIPCSDHQDIHLDEKPLSLEVNSVRNKKGIVQQYFDLPSGTWQLKWPDLAN